MNYVKLFFMGMLQVTLISANTWQIANEKWLGMFLIGFSISAVWVFNVKRAAFGNWIDRIVYPLGAACGSLLGVYLTKTIYGG